MAHPRRRRRPSRYERFSHRVQPAGSSLAVGRGREDVREDVAAARDVRVRPPAAEAAVAAAVQVVGRDTFPVQRDAGLSVFAPRHVQAQPLQGVVIGILERRRDPLQHRGELAQLPRRPRARAQFRWILRAFAFRSVHAFLHGVVVEFPGLFQRPPRQRALVALREHVQEAPHVVPRSLLLPGVREHRRVGGATLEDAGSGG